MKVEITICTQTDYKIFLTEEQNKEFSKRIKENPTMDKLDILYDMAEEHLIPSLFEENTKVLNNEIWIDNIKEVY